MNCVATPGYLRFPHIHADLLAFVAEDDVWLAPADGGRAWRLTTDGGQASHPRFSPDGAKIAWTSWRDGGIPEIYTAAIDDGTGGPATRRTYWGDVRTRTTGWTDAGEVLATTAVDQPTTQRTWAYAVPLDGPPRRLLFGQVNDLALTTTATALLTGQRGEPAYWKRYRGGTAGRLWVATGDDPIFTRVLGQLNGQLASPAADRGPAGLHLRPRGHRQHLLGRARRLGPAPAYRPRRLLRPQRGHRRHPRRLPPGRRHLAARQPGRRRAAAQARPPARRVARRPRAEADHRRGQPGRPRLRPDRPGERGDGARDGALADARRRPGPGAAGRPGRAGPAAPRARQDRHGGLGHRRRRPRRHPDRRGRARAGRADRPRRPDHRVRRGRQRPVARGVAGRREARRRRRTTAGCCSSTSSRPRSPSWPATTTARSRTSPGRPTRPGWPGPSRGRSRRPGSGSRGSKTGSRWT